MAFRNELNASQERVRVLQQELDELRGQRERSEALEERLEQLSRELEQARAELVELKGPPRQGVFCLGPCIALLVAGGTALYFWLAPAEPMPRLAPLPPFPSPMMPPPPIPVPASPPPAPDKPKVQAELAWRGRVRTAQGGGVAPGTACTLEVNAVGARTEHVVLRCGKVTLYDSEDALNGMSAYSSGLYEKLDPAGYRYELVYSDIGTRSGERAQLTLDSRAKQAVAFRETAPTYRVEVALDTVSEPRAGEPLIVAREAKSDTVKRKATVASVEGGEGAPVRSGDSCALEVRVAGATSKETLCLTTLRCGARLLYGGPNLGYAGCRMDGAGLPRTFNDDKVGEDPALRLDLAAATGELRTQLHTLKLTLSEP